MLRGYGNMEIKIIAKNEIEERIISSKDFKKCKNYGRIRSGHPEGIVGKHIQNILDYIEENYKEDPDYEKLRLLALLHDIGKFEGYNIPHSKLSEEISKKFITDERLLVLILLHDKPYSFWKKFKKHGEFDRKEFYETFRKINWRLLVKFRYCDNCSRSQEPSIWFDEKCKQLFS